MYIYICLFKYIYRQRHNTPILVYKVIGGLLIIKKTGDYITKRLPSKLDLNQSLIDTVVNQPLLNH